MFRPERPFPRRPVFVLSGEAVANASVDLAAAADPEGVVSARLARMGGTSDPAGPPVELLLSREDARILQAMARAAGPRRAASARVLSGGDRSVRRTLRSVLVLSPGWALACLVVGAVLLAFVSLLWAASRPATLTAVGARDEYDMCAVRWDDPPGTSRFAKVDCPGGTDVGDDVDVRLLAWPFRGSAIDTIWTLYVWFLAPLALLVVGVAAAALTAGAVLRREPGGCVRLEPPGGVVGRPPTPTLSAADVRRMPLADLSEHLDAWWRRTERSPPTAESQDESKVVTRVGLWESFAARSAWFIGGGIAVLLGGLYAGFGAPAWWDFRSGVVASVEVVVVQEDTSTQIPFLPISVTVRPDGGSADDEFQVDSLGWLDEGDRATVEVSGGGYHRLAGDGAPWRSTWLGSLLVLVGLGGVGSGVWLVRRDLKDSRSADDAEPEVWTEALTMRLAEDFTLLIVPSHDGRPWAFPVAGTLPVRPRIGTSAAIRAGRVTRVVHEQDGVPHDLAVLAPPERLDETGLREELAEMLTE